MDTDEFIETYQNRTNRYTLFDIVYDDLVEYCRDYNVSDDVQAEELEEVTEQIIREL